MSTCQWCARHTPCITMVGMVTAWRTTDVVNVAVCPLIKGKPYFTPVIVCYPLYCSKVKIDELLKCEGGCPCLWREPLSMAFFHVGLYVFVFVLFTLSAFRSCLSQCTNWHLVDSYSFFFLSVIFHYKLSSFSQPRSLSLNLVSISTELIWALWFSLSVITSKPWASDLLFPCNNSVPY